MTTTFKLRRVQYMPKELEAGVFYVAEEFDVAGHLCACGCGNKVITPLGPAEWSFEDTARGPTLEPSIGSWQLACKSHYWIFAGEVQWSKAWTPAQIEHGRRAEEERRQAYYESRKSTPELVNIPRLLGEANAYCSTLGEEIPLVLMRLVPQRGSFTEAQRTVHALVERAAVWMQSMSKLDRWTDYQAHSSGCRAMLELAVDVALITSEPALATRMWAFEESAKLKSCNRYRAFAIKTNLANANGTKMTFGSRNEGAVKALRRQHWGSENHPQTWFGKPFEQMAAEADRRVGSDYEAVYANRYDELCWGTHGSTLALIRPEGLPPDVIPAIACAALGEASRLALELTERAATFLGLDGDVVCEELFEKMQVARERYRTAQP